MNNSISYINPTFRAKVNLTEIAGKLKDKNPDAIKKNIESFSRDFPNYTFSVRDKGENGALLVLEDSTRCIERLLKLSEQGFQKLLAKTQEELQRTFCIACEALSYAVEDDVATTHKLDKAIQNGSIIEGSKSYDLFLADSNKKVEKFINNVLENEEILSKAILI